MIRSSNEKSLFERGWRAQYDHYYQELITMRAVIAACVGAVLALFLLSLGMWLELRVTDWGEFVRVAYQTTPENAFHSVGDPFPMMERGWLIQLWVVNTLVSIIVAAVARLINRRTTLLMCVAVVLPIAAIPLIAAFELSTIAASAFYVFAAFATMKAVDVAKRSAPTAARSA